MNDQRKPRAPTLRKVWRAPLPDSLFPIPVVFARSGERVAVAGNSTNVKTVGSLTVFNASTGAVVRQTTVDDWLLDLLAFSPDGRWLATAERLFVPAVGLFK